MPFVHLQIHIVGTQVLIGLLKNLQDNLPWYGQPKSTPPEGASAAPAARAKAAAVSSATAAWTSAARSKTTGTRRPVVILIYTHRIDSFLIIIIINNIHPLSQTVKGRVK